MASRSTVRLILRCATFVALLAGSALAFSACGDDDREVVSGGTDTTDATDVVDPVPPTDEGRGQSSPGFPGTGETLPPGDPNATVLLDPDVEYQRVEPHGDTADARPVPFLEVLGDGTSLEVRYVSGVEPCSVLDRVDVEESADAVTLTVWIGREPTLGPDMACIELAAYFTTTIELDAPLGGRIVVDGAA